MELFRSRLPGGHKKNNQPYSGQYLSLLNKIHTKIIKTSAHFYPGCFNWIRQVFFLDITMKIVALQLLPLVKNVSFTKRSSFRPVWDMLSLQQCRDICITNKEVCVRQKSRMNTFWVRRSLAATDVPQMCIWEAHGYSESNRENLCSFYKAGLYSQKHRYLPDINFSWKGQCWDSDKQTKQWQTKYKKKRTKYSVFVKHHNISLQVFTQQFKDHWHV